MLLSFPLPPRNDHSTADVRRKDGGTYKVRGKVLLDALTTTGSAKFRYGWDLRNLKVVEMQTEARRLVSCSSIIFYEVVVVQLTTTHTTDRWTRQLDGTHTATIPYGLDDIEHVIKSFIPIIFT